MKFRRTSFNNGLSVFKDNFSQQMKEIESTLEQAQYHFQHSNQEDRGEYELIWDPKGANAELSKIFSEKGWKTNVGIKNPGADKGKDVDIAKGKVAGEIQFGNFAYLDADMNRLKRLFDGDIMLETDIQVEAGVEIVVNKEMPSSNSVSHYQQAKTRAAPKSLINKQTCPNCNHEFKDGIPFLIYGIESPERGQEVVWNNYPHQKSRNETTHKKIGFEKKFVPDKDSQQKLSNVGDISQQTLTDINSG